MRKQKKITLEAVYNDWAENGGVFSDLENLFPNDLPWREQITGLELDYSYYGNHSGAKIVSPLIHKILTEDGLTATKRNTLATIIWHKYGINWNSLWETMFYEYDPISNYDRTEHRETTFGKTEDRTKTGSETDTHTGTDTNSKSGKETLTKSGSEAKAHTGTVADVGSDSTTYGKKEEIDSDRVLVNDKNAFNSSSWVNDTRTTESGGPTTQLSGTDTSQNGNTRTFNDTETETYTNRKDEREFTNYQEQETKNLTDQHTYNNVKDAYEEGGTEEEDTHISGNIGVTTSQQMIEQERALWDWSFFERVFDDVDKVLTIGAFGCEDELDIDYIELRLPIASTTKLGAIKVGANLTIEEDGTLNAQAGGGGSGNVDDVRVNGQSVVVNKIANVNVPTKTSDLQNDSGFVNAQQAANVAPVQSVNGRTGAVSGLAEKSYVDSEISALQDIVDGNTDDIADLETALNNKVDKVSGKGLSTEDFTTAEKNKLAGIEAGAQVNVQADWNEADSTADDYIKNKPTIPSPYTLPIASASDLGGVKIGSGVSIAADGTISVSGSGGGTTVHTIDITSRVLNNGDYTQQLVNFTVDTSTEKVKRILVALTVNLMYGGGLYFVLSNRANMYVGDINVSDLSFTTNYGLRASYWDISQFTAEGHGFQVGGYSADMTSGVSTVYDGPAYIDTTGTNIQASDGYYSIQMSVRNAPGGTTVYGKVIYETEAI